MEEEFLNVLYPSLFVFSSIGFSILFITPQLSTRLRNKLDELLSRGSPPAHVVFYMLYFISISHEIIPLALIYIIAGFLLLLSPLQLCLRLWSYYLLVFNTALTISFLIMRLITTLIHVLRISRVTEPLRTH